MRATCCASPEMKSFCSCGVIARYRFRGTIDPTIGESVDKDWVATGVGVAVDSAELALGVGSADVFPTYLTTWIWRFSLLLREASTITIAADSMITTQAAAAIIA